MPDLPGSHLRGRQEKRVRLTAKHASCATKYTDVKDRAHLSTFEFFILEKFSCIVVLIVFFVIIQSSGLISVWFRQNMTFFINFISFHIFAIYVGGACWGLPTACRLIAVSGARLPSVDGLTVRYIKNAPLLNLPSKYVCDLFQPVFNTCTCDTNIQGLCSYAYR